MGEPQERALTPKQARFVDEYLIDLNATQAGIRAGYKHPDIGRRLVTKSHVQNAVAARRAELSAKTGATVERVVKRFSRIAFADMGTYLELGADGTVRLDWSKLPKGATKIIQEVTQEEHTGGRGHEVGQIRRTKFKLYSQLDALDKLAKHLGMYEDKGNQTVNLFVGEVRDVIVDATPQAAPEPQEPPQPAVPSPQPTEGVTVIPPSGEDRPRTRKPTLTSS